MRFNLITFLFTSNQQIKISKQNNYTSGGSGGCQIAVMNMKSNAPLQSKIAINLLNKKRKLEKKLYNGSTNENGVLTTSFDLPKVTAGEYFLEIKASSKSGSDKKLEKINIFETESVNRITITLDKPLYKPGDEINFRTLLTSIHDDKPVKKNAKIYIFDGNENQVYSKTLPSSEYGIISGKFQLAHVVNSGTYKFKVETDKITSEKNFDVKPYILPKFQVKIDTDKKEYLVGELIRGKVKADYYFGEPVKNGKVTLKLNNHNTKTITLNDHGEGQFNFNVSTEGEQSITAEVIDLSNYLVEETKTVFSGRNKIKAKMIAENKELIPGIPNEVYIFTSKIDGTPMKTYITLNSGQRKEISTDENGVAKFTIEPELVESTKITDRNRFGKTWNSFGKTGDILPGQSIINCINRFNTVNSGAEITVDGFIYTGLYYPRDFAPDDIGYINQMDAYIISSIDLYDDGTLKSIVFNRYENGKEIPAKSHGIIEGNKSVSTTKYGQIGSNYYINANISDEDGNIVTQQNLVIPVASNNAGVIIRPEKSLYNLNEKISVNILSNLDSAETQLYIAKDNQILKMINTTKDKVSLELPKGTYGLIDIYAEKQGSLRQYRDYSKAVALRSVFIKPDKKMMITLNKENSVYKPGEDLQLSLDIKDDKNKPLNSAVMLSIVDEALLSLKNNDMSLDNLKLALSGIEMQENINGIDLHTAILNNLPETTLAALLQGRSGEIPGMRDIEYDNVLKKETTLTNMLIWICLFIFCLFIYLSFRFSWFQFALFHIIGFIIVSVFGLFLLQPNSALRFIATIIALIIFYIMLIKVLSVPQKNVEKLKNPVATGITIVILGLMFISGIIIDRYIMPMFDKSKGLSMNTASHLQSLTQNSDMMSFESENSSSASEQNDVTAQPDSVRLSGETINSADKGLAEVKRIRTKFLESMYFNPQVIAKDGKASIKIPLADNITTWRIQAVANSLSGYLGYKDNTVKVFQDFFVDFELPKNLTVDDEISIPVTVFNYLNTMQEVKLSVQTADWFTLLEGNDKVIKVGAGQQQLVYIPIKVNKFGAYDFNIKALGKIMSDQAIKQVKVYPNGYKIEEVSTSGKIDKKAEEKVFFLGKDIENTRKLRVKIYPTPIAQVIEGLESILAFPSGCFEQTSSSLYPDILILRYLKDSKQSKPEIEAKAYEYIEKGFQTLLTYEVSGEKGGFSLYGDGPAETVLTAYGLMQFNDLKEVYPVDENILNRMKEFIFSKQNWDGTFKITGNHFGGATSSEKLALNAYIGWALSETCKNDSRLKNTVEYLKSKAYETNDNSTLALIANVLVNVDDKDAKKILNMLMNKITIDKDQNAYLKSEIRDYYGSYGSTQDIQTTALASIALSNYNAHPKTNKQFISYILTRKTPSGTFGSTQTTTLALKALVVNEKKSKSINDIVKIKVNEVEKQIKLNADNYLNFHQEEFVNLGKDNSITIQANTGLTYEIVKEHYVPYDQAKTVNSFEINRDMNNSMKVNDEIEEKIRISNKSKNSVENLMVTVQIPQGFTVDETSLKALKDKHEIEKYEMGYDRINFYIRSYGAYDVKSLIIKMRARYPEKVTTSAVHVYDYYNPEVEAKLKPMIIDVNK